MSPPRKMGKVLFRLQITQVGVSACSYCCGDLSVRKPQSKETENITKAYLQGKANAGLKSRFQGLSLERVWIPPSSLESHSGPPVTGSHALGGHPVFQDLSHQSERIFLVFKITWLRYNSSTIKFTKVYN